MNYKDSIIKVETIFPKTEKLDDGKQDILIKIPLTEILDTQAKTSFALGVKAMDDFFNEAMQDEQLTIESLNSKFAKKLIDWQLK